MNLSTIITVAFSYVSFGLVYSFAMHFYILAEVTSFQFLAFYNLFILEEILSK